MSFRRRPGRRPRRPVEDVDGVGLGRAPEDEVADEIGFHLDARAAELEARGLAPAEARRQAEAEFGDVEDARREMASRTSGRRRKAGRARVVADAVQDVGVALRQIRATPGWFLVAAASLGVGIAAVATMGTAIDRLFIRPLPYDPDEELIFVGTAEEGRGTASGPMTSADFIDLRDGLWTADLVAWHLGGANLGGDPPTWIRIRYATTDFFDVLGVSPERGRSFTPGDAEPGAPDVTILTHALWVDAFGAAPDVVGSDVLMDGVPVRVVGVLPEGFEFSMSNPDAYRPLRLEDPTRSGWTLSAVGRRRGVDMAAVRAELDGLAGRLAAEHPATNADRTFPAEPVLEAWYGGTTMEQGVMGAAVAALLVFLVACANVAGLLLARGTDRLHEIALRRSLGAGRGRILRQLLTEASVLAVVAGIAAALASVLGVRGLASLVPDGAARAGEVAFDTRSFLLTMAVALGSTVVFALLPALRTLSVGRASVLAGPSVRGRPGRRTGTGVLVAAEVAMAAALVVTSVAVLRSAHTIRSFDTGLRTAHVWSFSVNLPGAADGEAAAGALDRMADEVAALPGIDRIGLGVGLPGWGWTSLAVRHPTEPTGTAVRIPTRIAEPDFLEATELRPVRGRGITASDGRDAPSVALVNHLLAERLWPDGDPLGQTLVVDDRTVEIVGVMPDAREMGSGRDPIRMLYVPWAQWPRAEASVLVRTNGAPLPADAVRDVVARLPGNVAVRDLRTLDEVFDTSAEQFTAMFKLMMTMAAAALVLALAGVYASMSFSVARRTPEIGVRLALGADATSVRALVLRSAVALVLGGLTVGLALGWGASKGLGAFIVGGAASDPATYLGVATAVMAVALAAAWAPARRAARLDPMVALRTD